MNYGKTKLTLAVATALGTLAVAPTGAQADAHGNEMRAEHDDRALSVQLKDARLEGMVETTFLLNEHINPFDLDVEVREQVAYLAGTVSSEADKELAGKLAKSVEGVTKVSNEIAVDPTATIDVDTDDERWAQGIEDATITAAIKSRLLWNGHTDGLSIDVDTQNGRVRLTGEADSEAAAELAEQLAKDTRNVVAVSNELKVVPNTSSTGEEMKRSAQDVGDKVSDAWITSKIKWSYLLSDGVDALDVNVDTREGKVSISGSASSPEEKELMRRIAENVKGVRSVNVDQVTVGTSSA